MSYKLPRAYPSLGAYFAAKRKTAEFSQKDVAKKLGYSSSQFISNFERGTGRLPIRKLKTFAKLVKARNKEIRDLIISSENKSLSKALGV